MSEHLLPPVFVLASRFPDERLARRAYQQAQDAIFATACNLSTYRFLLNRVDHVAAIGDPPPPPLADQLTAILATGTPVVLPNDVLLALALRRAAAAQRGSWVERHFRPTE